MTLNSSIFRIHFISRDTKSVKSAHSVTWEWRSWKTVWIVSLVLIATATAHLITKRYKNMATRKLPWGTFACTKAAYLRRLDYILFGKALASDPNFRWCGSDTCTAGQFIANAGNPTCSPFPLTLPVAEFSNFTCVQCGFKTCNKCGRAAHFGITCLPSSGRAPENEEARIDPQSVEWLRVNAKKCPGCKMYIMKVLAPQGMNCDQIRCPTPGCRTTFCWSCGQNWKDVNHSYFNCSMKG